MKRHISFILLALYSLSAFAWSQKGHDVVAYIAECHLTPAAADSVSALLDGRSPVYWANWLDNASHTPPYAYTKTWHYKNIDAGVPYDQAPLEPKGDVVTATREQIYILSDSAATRDQKVLALKILVHVVGDMHQPMHMGHYSDRGGNNVKVRFFDRDTNLHSIWDGSLMNSAHSWSYTEWQQQLDRLNAEQEAAEVAGNIDTWASQTHSIASRVYDYFPENSKVSYNQIAAWSTTIEQQLLRGGLRLAHILNAIYDPTSTVKATEL
ncbi:MAG: S1/P1 nuclease [Muribaculaceae bacterium]|nr:S1/P1 nuclease [Muribaculaceae bacterium]